ncbi:MAG: hypothetical protein V3U71_09105 [Cocleimonas sp.]
MLYTTVTTTSSGSIAVLVFAAVFVIIGAVVAWATYEKPSKKK